MHYHDDILIYDNQGIWAYLHYITQELDIKKWGVFFHIKDKGFFYKSDGHIEVLADKTLPNDKLVYIPIETGHNTSETYPLEDNHTNTQQYRQAMWCFCIDANHSIPVKSLHALKSKLQLFSAYDATYKYRYPTWLPFLFTSHSVYDELNHSIRNRDKRIFLNGQPHTGKYTFLQCYVTYNFSMLPQPKQHIDNIYQTTLTKHNIHLIYITEIAMLDLYKQEWLYQQSQLDTNIVIISSIYDIHMLFGQNIITREILHLLEKYKKVLPSTKNRTNEIEYLERFIMKTKFIQPIVLQKNIHKDNILVNNFISLYQKVYTEHHGKMLVDIAYQNTYKLKDILNTVEKEAVQYAQSKIGNSQYKIASFLGMSRGALQHKLRKWQPFSNK